MKATEWNNKYPVGQSVEVTEDDKSVTFTQTRSEAWDLGDGTPVVMLDGKRGGYSLKRVKARV